ncbi:MAG: hypothetical protein AAF724_14460 [Pseudomonadota bacterium]
MTGLYANKARAFIDILGMVPRAARVSTAIENGRQPDRRDLKALGIEDIFTANIR